MEIEKKIDRSVSVPTHKVESGILYVYIIGAITNYYNYMDTDCSHYVANIPKVKQILLRESGGVDKVCFLINSNGGTSDGLSQLADIVWEIDVPTYSYIEGNCFSAAYHIASQCDYIYCDKYSFLGNIGALFTLPDTSNYISNYEAIYKRGGDDDYKKYPSDNSIARTLVEEAASVFYDHVARARGKHIKAKYIDIIRSGRVFTSVDALKYGLIDAIL